MQHTKIRGFRVLFLCILTMLLILSSVSKTADTEKLDTKYEERTTSPILTNEPESSEFKYRFLTENLTSEYQIANATTDSFHSNVLVLSDSKNNTHFLWNQNLETSILIYYRVFYYSNQSFGEIKPISYIETPSSQFYDKNFDAKIDSNDRIHLVWQRVVNDEKIFYATIYNFNLESSSQRYFGSSYSNPAIAVDSQNRILVVCEFSGKIIGSFNDGTSSGWQSIDVTNSSFSNVQISLTVDSSNSFHGLVVSSNSVYYIKNISLLAEGVEWSVQNVSQAYGLDYVSANPHILYNSHTNLLYAAWDYKLADDDNRVVVINKTVASNFSNPFMYQSSTHELNPYLSKDVSNTMVLSVGYGLQGDNVGGIRTYLNITAGSAQNKTITTTNSEKARISVDLKRNIHILYYSTAAGDKKALYKLYDRDGPNLSFISPVNGTATNDKIDLNVTYAPDIFKVSYYYYEGSSPPSNPEDWNLIVSIVNDTNKNYNYTWVMDRDFLSIFIMANASDLRLLDETIIHSNITVDIHQPQKVEFISMTDGLGRDVAANKYGIGNITVSFNATDNCSRVDYVQLWNGSTLLATNSSWDAPNTLTWVSSSFPDGNYSNLYLRAYDRSGWFNDSLVFPTYVMIDNTNPQIVDIDNLNGTAITGTHKVRVQASADTASITMYFKNSTINFTKCVQNVDNTSGLMNYVGGNIWELNWRTVIWVDSVWNNLEGPYDVMFVGTDNFGNNNTLTISVIVDNTAPTVVIITPIYGGTVGYDVLMEWWVSADVVKAEIYHASTGTAQEIQSQRKYIPNGNGTIIPYNSTHSRVVYQMDAYEYRNLLDEGDTYFRVVLNCTDWVGLNTALLTYLVLNNQRPISPETIRIFALSTGQNQYKIEVSFGIGSGARLSHYLIYRSLTSFSVDYLNTLTISEMLDILGRYPGDKYCIDIVNYSNDLAINLEFTYIDENLSINTYYYTALLFNKEGNPSRIHDEISIEIKMQEPQKDINWDNFVAMPYVLGGIIGLLGIFTYTSIKATKTVRTSREVKKTYKEVFSEDEDFDLDKQLSALSALAKKQDITEDEFLTMKVEKDSPLDSGPSKIRKCEHCGWLLSADATICPRCQKTVL